ncbi:hypothetical protein DC498_11815 [Terrimonas sp.]|uniref:hypothetical protein n=1 Tax=Terrimonas sp. TaxID=1914338 RepID=UPI000D50DB02|nr:hypothetical protein [Terrimonas sp.]PVD52067.1 hypothetical protein DC498_11815 [Terrimonas sp.]
MASETEPDIKEFLIKILQAVTALVVWAVITMFFGLYLEWAHIHHHFNILNAIFYIWFVASFIGLIYFLYKVWKR